VEDKSKTLEPTNQSLKVTTQDWWEPLSLTPRFIAVPAGPGICPTVLTVSLTGDGKRLKPLGTAGLLDSTAMNRGVNEKSHAE
jgi:hypothetical protein